MCPRLCRPADLPPARPLPNRRSQYSHRDRRPQPTIRLVPGEFPPSMDISEVIAENRSEGLTVIGDGFQKGDLYGL